MRNGSRGYSLVEMLVGMSMAMLLTAFSFPGVQTSLGAYTVRSDARRVVAQIQKARFKAVSDNKPYRLHLNGDYIELQRSSGSTYTTVESFPISEGNSIITPWAADPVFSARGTVSPAASLTLANTITGKQNVVTISVLGVVTLQ